MILAGATALLLLLFSVPEPPGEEKRVTVRHQRIILRMPVGPAPARAYSSAEWRESRGPRCVPASSLAGATSPGPESIDLILRDSSRMRARLDRGCAALDFYRGFYLHLTADGRICADRDAIHSRSGGECRIDQFRTLSPPR
ncbi:MAG: hypothetical protein ACT4OE_07380 [Sphingosinicella sp.]